MDDELSDFFLLNDCLISGHMSPGPPVDFHIQSTRDSLLHESSHNATDFLYFDSESTPAYSTGSFGKRSSNGTVSATTRRRIGNIRDNVGSVQEIVVKTEEPLGRSPDHDYITDVKTEPMVDSSEYGVSSYNTSNSICSSKRTLSADQQNGSNNIDDESKREKFDIDGYFTSSIETKRFRQNGERETSSSSDTTCDDGTVSVNYPLRTGPATNERVVMEDEASYCEERVNEMDGNSTVEQSEFCQDDSSWPLVLPKEEDVTPAADDNSSTTSSDSYSHCDYLSPTPSSPAYQRGVRVSCASPYATSRLSRFRPANSISASNVNLNLRNRSKMQELAVKNHLISEQDPHANKGFVVLSVEERRTLIQEGLPVPSKLPLSKQEEEALKIVRRKIKNKLSAQESRRKRKEYVDTLEQQIEGYQTENSTLRRRIDALERTNQSLVSQLKKFQQQFTTSNNSTASTTNLLANNTQTSNDRTNTRNGSNFHHTVSLAAVFLLFAIMIPAIPVWPAVFRNAFVTNAMMANTFTHADGSPISGAAYADHSNVVVAPGGSRVLPSGPKDGCDIPYSAAYFEELNECDQLDLPDSGGKIPTGLENSNNSGQAAAAMELSSKQEYELSPVAVSRREGFVAS